MTACLSTKPNAQTNLFGDCMDHDTKLDPRLGQSIHFAFFGVNLTKVTEKTTAARRFLPHNFSSLQGSLSELRSRLIISVFLKRLT